MDLNAALGEAQRLAPNCRSLAELGRTVNEAMGLDWSDGKWRGIFKDHSGGRDTIQSALGKAPATAQLPTRPAFNVERFFELQVAAADEWAKRLPPTPQLNIQIETDVPIAQVFMSDFHLGAPGTAHLRLRDDLRTIAAHPHVYCGFGGDGINNFILQSLMFAGLDDIFAAGDQQLEIYLYLLGIVAETNSLTYVGTGNHDGWMQRLANLDPRWHMFRNVPHLYQGHGGIINLAVGRQTYRIFRRHRQRWSSVFNPAHAVVAEYQRNPWDFDIGVIEHQHMSHGAEFEGKMRADGSTTRIAIRPGTYKLYDPHAEEFGHYYASNELQCVILWPDQFRMHRIRGLQQTIEFLDALNG